MRLNLHPTGRFKALAVPALSAGVLCLCYPFVRYLMDARGFEFRNGSSAVGLSAALVLAALMLLLATVRLARRSARLDGTTVVLQHTIGRESVDLARSPEMWFERHNVRSGRAVVEIPYLYARRTDGIVVAVPLGTADGRLPARELAALADAIEAGGRDPERAMAASRIAAELRAAGHRLPG